MKRVFLFLIIITVIIHACKPKALDGDTIILLGEEKYVKPLLSMIPDTLSTIFVSHMGNIAEGYIPPNIEGEYIINPKQFCYSNFYNLFDNGAIYLKVTNQHNRIATVELYEEGYQRSDTAYIMGDGQFFTLYFNENREMSYYNFYSTITRNVFITGEKSDAGIKDLVFGNIILKVHNGGSPFVGNFVPGSYFIYKDKDGLSENTEWFDYQ